MFIMSTSLMTFHALILLVVLCFVAVSFQGSCSLLRGWLSSPNSSKLCNPHYLVVAKTTARDEQHYDHDGNQTQQHQLPQGLQVDSARHGNNIESLYSMTKLSDSLTTTTSEEREQNAMLRGSVDETFNKIAELEARVSDLQHLIENLTALDSGNNRHELQHPPPLFQLLPTCQEIMQRPNSPFADGSFITRHTTPYTWTPRADGSRQFEITSICRLKRYTSAQARQCLAGRHMAFVGDSLSKYQYISFMHFLELGVYPARFGRHKGTGNCTHIDENGNPTCSTGPNICMERDWRNGGTRWIGIHSALGGQGDGGLFRGRSECSCARYEEIGAENYRYVSDEIDDGTDDGGKKRIKLTYLSEFGKDDQPSNVKLWNFTDCSYTGTCRRTLADGEKFIQRARDGDWDFEEPLEVALQSSFRQYFPDVDVAIYNRGLWGQLQQDRARRIMPLLHSWAGGENGRCFFKSTTASELSSTPDFMDNEQGAIRDVTFHAGCGYLDFAHITDEFNALPLLPSNTPKQKKRTARARKERENVYWDKVHFMPWVYEELNNVMLNVLCNIRNED